jgi:hypothetical protein
MVLQTGTVTVTVTATVEMNVLVKKNSYCDICNEWSCNKEELL